MIPKLCLSLALFSSLAFAENPRTMNGYTLGQFGDFVHTWKLVTVRFRKDTGEMRFTYANDLAWQTLSQGKTNYPDGAVFAKVGIGTQIDPSFPNSAIPSGSRRIQFMVHNQEKHKDTDGWGYALFSPDGTMVFPDDAHGQAMACAACHKLVPERGYVFSQAMELPDFTSQVALWSKSVDFSDEARTTLSPTLRNYIPARFRKIRSLQGELRKKLFYGTLGEIRPLLSQETLRSGKPSALISEDGKLFSLVVPGPVSQKCSGEQKPFVGWQSVPNPQNPVLKINFCESAPKSN